MQEKAIIFDLDGTLINSHIDIATSANIALERFNLPIHEIEDYKKFLGSGVLVLIENCTPKDTSKELISKVVEEFKLIYDSKLHFDKTHPYEGIRELLIELKKLNVKIGVLSNKPHYFTLKYIEHYFKEFAFDEVHGQKEEVPKKPSPTGAIFIAESFKINPKNIYFIGDTDVDMQTAKNANMIAIGVKWGFREVNELLENGADFIVEKPIEILNFFKE